MKLSTKITCAMGTLFVCIALVGAFSVQRLNAVNQLYAEAAEVGFPLTITAQKLVILLAEYRRNEVAHVLNEDMDGKRRTGNRMRDLQESIEESLITYSRHALGPVRAAQARELERMWNDYAQSSASVRHLSMSSSREAVLLLNTRSSDQYDALAGMLEKVSATNALFSENVLQGGGELYSKSQMQLMALLLAVLLLETIIAVFLVRSVVGTLGTAPERLGAIARSVAQGDLSMNTEEPAEGVLADILRMVKALRRHGDMLRTLTSNIPGAVLRSQLDDDITLTYCSEGFLTMTGYTRDELSVLFDNHFVAMVAPDDRKGAIQSVREQLDRSDTYELQYRITHKNGSDVWVLDRGRVATESDGQRACYFVLIDISELKFVQTKLHQQEERLRTVLAVSNDIVWEADDKSLFRFIKGSEMWLQMYGCYPKNYSEALHLAHKAVHPDDADAFISQFNLDALMDYINKDVTSVRLEYRSINMRSGTYVWYQGFVVPFAGPGGEIERIMACVSNINDRKNRENKILHSARRDSLTNLYNKRFTEDEISRVLEEDTEFARHHALFIIDVDNFKAVNDNLGHLFGDAVLTDIASTLSQLFRSHDVVGRIGGDEFMVLMVDAGAPGLVDEKSKALCKALVRTFNGNGRSYSVSGSVGIALYPQDGTTYRDLYKNADSALYLAKHQGKSQACFYSQTLEHEPETFATARTGLTDMATRAESTSFKDNVLTYIFELLYEARDINTVINIALGMIGEHYDVSRAYVLLNRPDNLACSVAFEWCNEGVAAEKSNLQEMPYSICGNYHSYYTRDGVFYCDDVTKLDPQLSALLTSQGIRSMLHLAIYDEGKFRGCVGFDDCLGNRLWTRDEMSALSMLAKILGVFLLKDIMARAIEETNTNITTILDSMDTYAYVCDEETYSLLYINAKTKKIAPMSELGMPCHQAFFGGRTTPCEKCPRANLKELKQGGGKSLVVHNPTLDVWTRATAARIPWSGTRHAVLVSCVDITEYKKAAIAAESILMDAKPTDERPQ